MTLRLRYKVPHERIAALLPEIVSMKYGIAWLLGVSISVLVIIYIVAHLL